MIGAYAGIIIYVIGIPIVTWFKLWQIRLWLVAEADMSDEMHSAILHDHELMEIHNRITDTYGMLYLEYTPERWWWETFSMSEKASLTGMLAALPAGAARSGVGVILCTVALAATASAKPFRDREVYELQQGQWFQRRLIRDIFTRYMIHGLVVYYTPGIS